MARKYLSKEVTNIEIEDPTPAQCIESLQPVLERLRNLKAEDVAGICCSVVWRETAAEAKDESGFIVLGGQLPALQNSVAALVDRALAALGHDWA